MILLALLRPLTLIVSWESNATSRSTVLYIYIYIYIYILYELIDSHVFKQKVHWSRFSQEEINGTFVAPLLTNLASAHQDPLIKLRS